MSHFTARIKNGSKFDDITVVAESRQDAQIMASKLGRVISLKRSRSMSSMFSPGMSSAERVIFLRRLATMVRSRMGLSDSLKIMRSAFRGPISRVSNDLIRRVESGADFGDALVSMRKDFPQTTSALIRAGMRGGDIHTALQDAATFEAEMERVRRDSSRGIASAVMSFMMAAAIIIGSSFYLGPYVMESDMMRAAGDSVNIDWIFTTADVVAYFMLVIAVAFLALILLAYVVKPLFPNVADRIIFKVPIYRDLVMAQSHYTVFYGMGLLINSGVRVEDTLRLSHQSAPAGEVAEDLLRALTAVKAGKSWPMAMRHLHPTDRAALSTSQDREQVGEALSAVAIQHRDSYAQRVQQVVPILLTLSALFMSIGGALIFGMVVLPMLMMTQSMMS